jgi:hypothetical protein
MRIRDFCGFIFMKFYLKLSKGVPALSHSNEAGLAAYVADPNAEQDYYDTFMGDMGEMRLIPARHAAVMLAAVSLTTATRCSSFRSKLYMVSIRSFSVRTPVVSPV